MKKALRNVKNLGGGATLSSSVSKFAAFTLAEMMVVMLIMSVIMAAMAPVMTRKSRTDTSTPWKWSSIGSPHAYFGLNSSQTALIGQSTPAASDPSNKLTINATGNIRHILLKRGDSLATISLSNNGGLIYGNTSIDNVGENSISIGNEAVGSGAFSVGIGRKTSTSDNSVAIGNNARTQTIPSEGRTSMLNVAVGYLSTSIGGSNEASGKSWNSKPSVAVGTYSQALGQSSIALGAGAFVNKEGAIAIGSYASGTLSDGSFGTYVSGVNSIAIGRNAQVFADGALALGNNSVAGAHVKTGPTGGQLKVVGLDSIAIGNGASTTADGSIAIGQGAKASSSSVSIGFNASSSATGSYNVAVGSYSLTNNTTGEDNIALGYQALNRNTTGYRNVGIGSSSLYLNTTGSNNIAIAYHSMWSNTTGENNVALGEDSLYHNTTGGYNVALGYYALYNNTTGSNNVGIGREACRYVTGNNKVCIGVGSGPSSSESAATNMDRVIFLGDNSTTVYIPGKLLVGGSVELGTSKTSTVKIRSGWTKDNTVYNDTHFGIVNFKDGDYWDHQILTINDTTPGTPSDRRLKYVGAENKDGLAKLRQLKVFNYTFKKDEKKTPRVGVIAQDLQKVFPKAVIKGEDGFLSIRMEDMFYAVINAIKELDAKVTILINSVQQLQKETKQLRAENKELKKRLEALERAR